MSRPVAVLRPEPGNAATAARVEERGLRAIRLALFTVRPCAWAVPDPAGFDALLLTSANAVRHAGPGLTALAVLPVLAVGAATAEAARAAGLDVRLTGEADAAALLSRAGAMGVARALHLAGREHGVRSSAVAGRAIVYASDPIAPPAGAIRALAGAVALLHSPRAAARLAGLVDAEDGSGDGDRAAIRLAALSEAVAAAAGGGWAQVAVAAAATDAALLDAAVPMAG